MAEWLIISRQRARKRYSCDDYPRCTIGAIEPGQEYVRHALAPGAEYGPDDHWWVLRLHTVCDARYRAKAVA